MCNWRRTIPSWLTAILLALSVPSILWALTTLPMATRRTLPDETVALLQPAPASDHWIVVFGYPTCGDVCPAALSALGSVVKRRAKVAAPPGVTFVSTGYEPDPTAADRLARRVHPDFRGVRVSHERLSLLADVFGAEAGAPASPSRGHRTAVHLLARAEGRWQLRAVFPSSPPDVERILEKLETL